MLTNIIVEHKFKLGDKIWLKAQSDIYKTCKTCKHSNNYIKIVKIISGKITRIRINSYLGSPNKSEEHISYDIVFGKNNLTATAKDNQCFASKNEAKKSKSLVVVYGI